MKFRDFYGTEYRISKRNGLFYLSAYWKEAPFSSKINIGVYKTEKGARIALGIYSGGNAREV